MERPKFPETGSDGVNIPGSFKKFLSLGEKEKRLVVSAKKKQQIALRGEGIPKALDFFFLYIKRFGGGIRLERCFMSAESIQRIAAVSESVGETEVVVRLTVQSFRAVESRQRNRCPIALVLSFCEEKIPVGFDFGVSCGMAKRDQILRGALHRRKVVGHHVRLGEPVQDLREKDGIDRLRRVTGRFECRQRLTNIPAFGEKTLPPFEQGECF
jgi:hypothetical protein